MQNDNDRLSIQGFKGKIQFYLVDINTPLGKFIDIFIIFLNISVCILYVLQTYPLPPETAQILWRLEELAVFIFIVEYIARLYAAPHRIKQIFDIYSLIDLVAILPTLSEIILPLFGLTPHLEFIHTLRAFRVFRIFRFLRFTADTDFFFGKINQHILRIVRLILTIVIIFFISSGLFFYVENQSNTLVDNFGDALYFTVVTLTTVGFGDITPVSQGGRWITILMIFSGITLIPWQVGQIVKEWLIMSNKREVICPNCGLKYHDYDASHCKACGHVIFQVYDGS